MQPSRGQGARLMVSAACALTALTACASPRTADPASVWASVSSLVSAPEPARSSRAPRPPSTPAPAPLVTLADDASESAEGEPSEEPTADPTADGSVGDGSASGDEPSDQVTGWAAYPWPPNDDGKACTAPAPPDPDGTVVVLLGDSHIRNAKSALRSQLRAQGFSPVFVCWGGRTTQWGIAQLDTMRRLGVTPRCLVINLGTNDVKNDAVSAGTLGSRLQDLLAAASGIQHVMLVDIWANTALAPSTMKNVSATVPKYPEAAAATGVGSVLQWAERARANPGYVGDDGVHDTSAGSQVRTQLITDAVASRCG